MRTLLSVFLFFLTTEIWAGPQVKIETSVGNMVLELDAEKAPITVGNFLYYVDTGFYNGTIIHRVVKGFVIQGGGYTTNMTEKQTESPIINESKNGLSNLRGTIGMARTSDPNSATSQFFINTVDNQRLDYQSPEKPGYAVFGKIISGFDVLDKIENAVVKPNGEHEHFPIEQIEIRIKRN